MEVITEIYDNAVDAQTRLAELRQTNVTNLRLVAATRFSGFDSRKNLAKEPKAWIRDGKSPELQIVQYDDPDGP